MDEAKSPRILLVEDDYFVQADLEERLTALGFSLLDAVDAGEKVLPLLQGDTPPEVIIMDIQLAGKWDGIDTAHQVLAIADIPIIYLTDHTHEEAFQRALATRPVAFLHKPFEDTEVAHNIEIALLHEAEKDSTTASENDPIIVNDGIFISQGEQRFTKIPFEEIAYLEADRAYCMLHLLDGKVESSSHNMKFIHDIIQRTPYAQRFMKVHRSYTVNLLAIQELNGNQLQVGKHLITVSPTYLPEVKKRFFTA